MVHRLVALGRSRVASARDDERGVVMVLVAILMVVALGFVALSIDLGAARQIRRQAKTAADAAALAGVQRLEDLGSSLTGTATQWQQVVSDVKAYAKSNYNVASSAWVGCSDPLALTYKPDTGNQDTCISADMASWPVPLQNETTRTNRLRVRLPSRSMTTMFGGALGVHSLTVNASSTAGVTRTKTSVTSTVVTQSAGGPCALCVLGPGLALDGQNGDIAITGGSVVVDSTASTGAQLNPNGHVRITATGYTIGGPGAPGNFSGTGFSPSPTTQDPIDDPLAALPQCGTGSTCPINAGVNGTKKDAVLSPGIYSSISGSHTLSPGIYVLKGDITLNGNDVITGSSGVMLYFACSNYPTPCAPGQAGAGIKATGNGAMHLDPPTTGQCTTTPAVCPYVGLIIFSDRNNTSTITFRGNGTNENGSLLGSAGTIYVKSGIFDLRGNGYTLASEVVVGKMTMEGNPSGVTIAYDLSRNVPLTHGVTTTTTTTAFSYDAGGLLT